MNLERLDDLFKNYVYGIIEIEFKLSLNNFSDGIPAFVCDVKPHVQVCACNYQLELNFSLECFFRLSGLSFITKYPLWPL